MSLKISPLCSGCNNHDKIYSKLLFFALIFFLRSVDFKLEKPQKSYKFVIPEQSKGISHVYVTYMFTWATVTVVLSVLAWGDDPV
jgi:hypothetical protein